ncbi:hypothetical protein GCM10010918_50580 [Paenibacillus radicis (ex Gao et al. 2016)]|uniref:Uncharacterized protein n=2 Tax=Paenibacillus radicis (ex Gao et al. 2016) TaxID=1737354 RepID=A0A917M9M1_9BACL|nr:hypothetical protein GCM10010918_50580 [Paenibacillus radicis (ex Gao et al. 2016)]
MVSIIGYFYVENSNLITLEEPVSIDSSIDLTGTWWFMAANSDDENLMKYGISTDGIDFEQHNVVVSNGREIQKMSFVRSDKFPFRRTHFAKVLLKKEIHKRTWFVYKMKKMEVYMDERYFHGNIQISK